jgi:hypothetical protein
VRTEREKQVDASEPVAASRVVRWAPDRPDMLAVAGNNAVGRALGGNGAMSVLDALELPGAVGNAAVQRAIAHTEPQIEAPAVAIQRTTAEGGIATPDEDFAEQLAAVGSGTPLASNVRSQLEQRLDTSLSGVRVHTDPSAARVADAVNATAFTTGQDIYFSAGAYQPGTGDGQKLLAHEAVHTIQQAAGPVDGTDHGAVSISDPADRFEREASRVAASATEPAPVAVHSRGVGGVAVQRDQGDTATATAVTWTAPADITVTGQPLVCQGGAEVAAVLSYLAAVLRQHGAALDSDADTALGAMAEKVDAESARYAATGSLDTSDPSYLTGYVQLAEGLLHQQIEAAVSRCLAQIVIPEGDDAQFQSVLDDLAEESHQAYIGSNNSRLEGVLGTIEKISKLNGKIKDYSGKALKVTDLLKEVRQVGRLGELAKKINELSKEVGEQVESAKQIFEVARDLATLAGIDNTSNGTAMMQGINQFSAGIDLVDKTIGRFGKAVPLFGELWSKWYKPMIDACIKGLNVIARHQERQDREFEILDLMVGESDGSLHRDAIGAPILSAAGLASGAFPGGQAVFSYVYAIRHGGTPATSDTVRDYFLDRAEQFNIHQEDEKLEESSWKLLHASTWTRSGRSNNVAVWVGANIDKVWGLLYGDLGRYIP